MRASEFFSAYKDHIVEEVEPVIEEKQQPIHIKFDIQKEKPRVKEDNSPVSNDILVIQKKAVKPKEKEHK